MPRQGMCSRGRDRERELTSGGPGCWLVGTGERILLCESFGFPKTGCLTVDFHPEIQLVGPSGISAHLL